MSSVLDEGGVDKIVIFIDSRNGYRAKLAINPSDKLELLFKKYCNKLNLPVGTMRFLMDGNRVEGKKTAGQLRKEVDESEGPGHEIVIQALEPLHGGGPGENDVGGSGKRKVQEVYNGVAGDVSVALNFDAGKYNLGMSVAKKLKTFECKVNLTDDGKISFQWNGQIDKDRIAVDEESEVATQKVPERSGGTSTTDVGSSITPTRSLDTSKALELTIAKAVEKVRMRFYHLGESILMVENAQDVVEDVLVKYSQLRKAKRSNLRFFAAGDRLNPLKTVGELKQDYDEYLNQEDEIEIDVGGEMTGGAPGGGDDWFDDEMPKVVELLFEMPDGEHIPLKISSRKTLSKACKILCDRKQLDWETSRFLWKGDRVIFRMLAGKFWKSSAENGVAVINVVTGCRPYVYSPRQPEPVVSPQKCQKQYSSEEVTFVLQLSGYEVFKIAARKNQLMGYVLREWSHNMGTPLFHFRFLYCGDRINDLEFVGEFIEEHVDSDEAGQDIEIEVHPLIDGGNSTLILPK